MTRKSLVSHKKSIGARKRSAAHSGADWREVGLPETIGSLQAAVPGSPLPIAKSLENSNILIAIDPAVSGTHIHDRFDIAIRGRVVASVPISEIRLQVDEWVTGTASFGQPKPVLDTVVPDRAQARQWDFQFNLPCPGEDLTNNQAFQIVARTANGVEQAQDFVIAIDPEASNSVSVIAGTTFENPCDTSPPTILYIERGAIDADGVLNVVGWAVSLTPIQEMRILTDQDEITTTVIDIEREDVEAVFPTYPSARLSGFNMKVQLTEADRATCHIRSRIVCCDGFGQTESIPVERVIRHTEPSVQSADHRLAEPATAAEPQRGSMLVSSNTQADVDATMDLPRTPPLTEEPPPEIRMHCDRVTLEGDGILSIDGWAASGTGIIQVRVLLDDHEVGLASIGHERRDVGATYSEIPMSHLSGFRFDKRIADRFEGEHTVRIIARNMADSQEERQVKVFATAIAEPEDAPAIGQPEDSSELTPAQAAEFRFELDSPPVSNGAAVAVVTGRLTIDGWVLTRSGIASFEVFFDGQRLGEAHYGLARQDVGAAFPEWPNALRGGYAFHCPPRSLRDGDHTIELRIVANNGIELTRAFRITVKKADEQNDSVGIRRRMARVEADMMASILAGMDHHPEFQFILRQDQPIEAGRLRATLDALRLQAYPNWTVKVLAGDDAIAAAFQTLLDQTQPELADRFTLLTPADAALWSAPLADCADSHTQLLYSLLLAGDEPGVDALLELAVASGRHPDHDLIYGDEVRPSPVSKENEAFFKPDFSLDLLLSTNYIGRPWTVTAALLAKTAATPASLNADGEYDLLLRCTEYASGIHHIPKLLSQRSALELDNPSLEQAALERSLARRGIAAEVVPTVIPGTWRVRRSTPRSGKVSIIIPTCAANGYIETCISTLRAKTSYRDYEIVCIDNIRPSDIAWKVWLQQNADKIVDVPGKFNWSVFNNRAVEAADGEFLLFLNDDIEIIQDDWLDAMMEHARRPEVGITGPQLLYRDGKVQHAGMFLANPGIGRHAFRFSSHDDPGYFGLALTQRNVIAVTGACMLVRRDIFEQLGRFDEAHEIVNNDLDFCLRAHRAGLLTVFTPYATLIHYELASRANMKDVFDLTHFNAAWKTTFAAGDPYFNLRLSRHDDDYRSDDEPVQWVVSGGPLFLPADIQRILVVKLDHIGDFVTALPPIRQLKKLFPHARITVLAGPASRAFIALEPCIDEFIPFAFFHARSQLGEREVTKEDYAALADQLRPYRFDLAVDLRKHLSTRDVLKYTGARFLAGFDYLGQFPYLDIALDWDGDRTLQRKRNHIVDDLIALVNAIGHAAKADREVMQPGPLAMSLQELPDQVQALFVRPVVAIHPGAGNVTKQWPQEHFSALIDLLIEKNNVSILLVGGPDEVEVANALLAGVQNPHAVASMAGKTSLADLPRLLKTCALYIGNDSGPKHIAASVGIPTIGIHSGVVDPVEWGPIGPSAVALRRNMTCSPCYLAKAEDCPRSLACLRLLEPNLVYETADTLLQRFGPAGMPRAEAEFASVTIDAETVDGTATPSDLSHDAPVRRGHRAIEPV